MEDHRLTKSLGNCLDRISSLLKSEGSLVAVPEFESAKTLGEKGSDLFGNFLIFGKKQNRSVNIT